MSNWFLRISDPARLAGPIFDKELRVSSRRRRNYALRFLYVALFTVLLSLFWVEIVAHSTSSVYQVSRMARAGQGIICVVVWFQFLMTQVVAIVMLSTSISDEIYHRTLGVLMTTPIGSFQIVLGKLLSKLLQLVLLLGIALPLLAIVRVLGGVPWDFLICSLCVTLTTVVFVGSLSLFFSIFTRRAYVTIIATILALGLLFAFIPMMMVFLARSLATGVPLRLNWQSILAHINPYFTMVAATEALASARPVASSHWLAHCGIALGVSALLLLAATIGSFQIVLGKLRSKLRQLVLLLGIALPLLAIARVLGGVPWDFLICSLCVTLTTVVFVGSLSLFFSIFTRRAYVTIIATILALGLLFAFIPMMMVFLARSLATGGVPLWLNWQSILGHINPYFTMVAATEALASARPVASSHWLAHCGIALGVSALLLLAATILVRRAALRQVAGAAPRGDPDPSEPASEPASTNIRPVAGSPVFWKERRTPLLGRRKVAMTAILLAALGLLLLTYVFCYANDMLDDDEVHAAYVVVFTGIGMLFTVVMPATCITSEKESRAWPLLLTTTLGDWEIVWGKLRGALWRCLPAWAPLFGHVLVFVLAGMIHPVALAQLGILVAWIMILLSSSGLYFSTRLKHTTAAVIANMGLAAGLWLIIPILLGITLAITRAGNDLLEVYIDLNPFVHAGVIAAATAERGGISSYSWMQGGITGLAGATGWIVLNFIVYVVIGLVFVARAGARLRRDPF